MLENLIMPGGKLELREIKRDPNSTRKLNTYVSQIYDIDEDETKMSIAMPIKEGRAIPLAVGSRYDAYFYTKKGIYASVVTITDRFRTSTLFVLVIELQTQLKKFQRRQYYRFDTIFNLDYVILNEEEQKLAVEKQIIPESFPTERIIRGTTMNISGGGMKFSGSQLKPEDKLWLEFSIAVNECMKRFRVIAHVVESTASANKAGLYVNRIEFEVIPKTDQETLIRYIFEEERKLRKNERI